MGGRAGRVRRHLLRGQPEREGREALRPIALRHPPIPEGGRRLESELWAAFEAARPRLLGALFDRVAAGLKALPGVDTAGLPRMADACAFALACEAGAGEEGLFLAAFRANQKDGHDAAMSDSPLVAPLLALMAPDREAWEGTATELLAALARHAPDPPPKDWPRKANHFSGQLRRLAPALRRVHGLDIDTEWRSPDKARTRRVRVSRVPAGAAGRSTGESRTMDPGPASSGKPPQNRADSSPPDGPDGPDDRGPLFGGRGGGDLEFTNSDLPDELRGAA